MLNDILYTFGENSVARSGKTSEKNILNFTRSLSKLPEYLEQFHDLIFSAKTDKLNKNVQKLFSTLFTGSIYLDTTQGFPTIVYKDPTGFTTEIESAGSGVVSLLPIISGMYYVEPNGSLIIEEPEAHLEPSRQLKIINALHSIASERKVDLIFTTHSDYVVKKLLALVSSKKMKHSDLGLYYFDRKGSDLTTIKQIPIDKTGEAEQSLFQDAIDELVSEFSE